MFFKNPVPEFKEDSPVDIKAFLTSGEYDQGDKAIIAYDDLYDALEEAKILERKRIAEEISWVTHYAATQGKDCGKDLMEDTITNTILLEIALRLGKERPEAYRNLPLPTDKKP